MIPQIINILAAAYLPKHAYLYHFQNTIYYGVPDKPQAFWVDQFVYLGGVNMRIFVVKKGTIIRAAVFILLVVGAIVYTQVALVDARRYQASQNPCRSAG